MQVFIFGIMIIALGIQSLILKIQFKMPGFRSFSRPYKYHLAALPSIGIAGILLLGVIISFLSYKPDINKQSDMIASAELKTKANPVPTYNNITNRVSSKISNREFYNTENGLTTIIKFEPSEEGLSLGAMKLIQPQCRYVYTYDIDGNNINIKFYGSKCGATASSQTLNYNQANDCISMSIDGQTFIFK